MKNEDKMKIKDKIRYKDEKMGFATVFII